MTIDKIEIDGFGKLTSFSMELNKGLNFIYGDNESGKSTICDFLLCMFYDMPNDGKKLGLSASPRKKYKPWSGARFGGRVHFTHEGKQYILEKTFGSTKRSDKAKLLHAATWEEAGTGENLGEKLFGLSREGFLKTLYVSSYGLDGGAEGNAEILKRLSNLETTGDEDISYLSIKTALEKQQHALLTKTGKGGKITALKEQETALVTELYNKERFLSKVQEDQSRKESLEQSIASIQKDILALEQAYQLAVDHKAYLSHKQTAQTKDVLLKRLEQTESALAALCKQYEEEQNKVLEIDPCAVQKAKELEQQLLAAEHEREERYEGLIHQQTEQKQAKEKQKKRGLLFAVCALLLFVAAGLAVLPFSTALSVLMLVLSPFAFGAVYLLFLRNNRIEKTEELRQKVLETEQTIQEIKNNIADLCSACGAASLSGLYELWETCRRREERLRELTQKRTELETEYASLKKNIQEIPRTYATDFSEEVMQYSGDTAETVAKKLSVLKEHAEDLNRRHYALSVDLAKQWGNGRTISDIESELFTVREQTAVLEKQYDALVKAGEWLARAHEEIKSNYAPRLNETIGKIFKELTCERYANIRLGESFTMHYQNEQNEIVEAEHLSCGTYDLLYIAFRLAAARVLFETAVPALIFDDAFDKLDDKRFLKAVTFLQNSDAFSQVLYFTCHETVGAMLEKENIHYKKL